MTQRYDENLILAYLEGDMNADEKARFETMLAGDEPLRQLVQSLADDRAALRNLPAQVPPSDLMQPVHERLERNMLLDNPAADTALPIARHRNRVSRLLALTALAALLMFVVGLVLHIWVFTFNLHDPSPLTQPSTQSLAKRSDPIADAPASLAHKSTTDASSRADNAVIDTSPAAAPLFQPSAGTGLVSTSVPGDNIPQPLAMNSNRSLASVAALESPTAPNPSTSPPIATVTASPPSVSSASIASPSAPTLELLPSPDTDALSAADLTQRVQVITADVQAAQAELREWVIANTLASRPQTDELRRQRTITLAQSESEQQRASNTTQLYGQYQIQPPAAPSPAAVNDQRRADLNHALALGSANENIVKLRLQADQLNALLTHLNRNQQTQKAHLIRTLSSTKQSIDKPRESPPMPVTQPVPAAPTSADNATPPALVDVIVEFVEPPPPTALPNE